MKLAVIRSQSTMENEILFLYRRCWRHHCRLFIGLYTVANQSARNWWLWIEFCTWNFDSNEFGVSKRISLYSLKLNIHFLIYFFSYLTSSLAILDTFVRKQYRDEQGSFKRRSCHFYSYFWSSSHYRSSMQGYLYVQAIFEQRHPECETRFCHM